MNLLLLELNDVNNRKLPLRKDFSYEDHFMQTL